MRYLRSTTLLLVLSACTTATLEAAEPRVEVPVPATYEPLGVIPGASACMEALRLESPDYAGEPINLYCTYGSAVLYDQNAKLLHTPKD